MRAGLLDILVEQVLEFGALAFVAGGVHVREIVRDHFHIGLLRQHAGRCDVQGTHRDSP